MRCHLTVVADPRFITSHRVENGSHLRMEIYIDIDRDKKINPCKRSSKRSSHAYERQTLDFFNNCTLSNYDGMLLIEAHGNFKKLRALFYIAYLQNKKIVS